LHPYLVLALVALIGLMVSISWLKRTAPGTRSRVLKRAALGAGIGLLVLLALTGRIHWLFAMVATLIPLLQRLLTASRWYGTIKSARGPSPGQTSTVETATLRMNLDHNSGEMDGEVRAGRFAGQRLSTLSFEQLLALLAQFRREDSQSAALLEAYLDRAHGDAWRTEEPQGQQASEPEQSMMSREEAYAVLGLKPGAKRDHIIEAHRRLMQRLHPDRGGSDFLAAKLNQAKDVLLGN
jgi:hypothetical protein